MSATHIHLPIAPDALAEHADAPPAPLRHHAFAADFAAGSHAVGELCSLDDGPGSEAAGEALRSVLEGLRRHRVGEPPIVYALADVPSDAAARLDEALGRGEVDVTVQGRGTTEIRETALPGLWRVRERDAEGKATGDYLEIADVPAIVRAAAERATRPVLDPGEPPPGAMNVQPLLFEIAHRLATRRAGDPPHVLSLSLMPMNEVDLAHLEARLGRGPVRAESRGYGRCVVELSGHRHTWRVRHFNVAGALVLDTIEIGDVPVAIIAAREDLEDSATRLAEMLGQR